jgi:ABC-2 type transport system permease protein
MISREGRAPGAFDFYAISMLVMFVSYIAQYAAQGVREDFLEPLGARARTTPAPWSAQVAGKLSAHVISGLVQAAIIVSVTGIAFGVDWGSRPLLLAALVFMLCIFSSALGAFVLSVTRDGPKSDGIVAMIIVGSMVLSGGGAPFSSANPGFRAFQELLPHFQGQRALLTTIYGGRPEAIGSAFVYFLGGTALLLMGGLAALSSRRRA